MKLGPQRSVHVNVYYIQFFLPFLRFGDILLKICTSVGKLWNTVKLYCLILNRYASFRVWAYVSTPFNDKSSALVWCAFCWTFHSDSEILFLDVYYTVLVHVVSCFYVCTAATLRF